jgi:peroxiredoxin
MIHRKRFDVVARRFKLTKVVLGCVVLLFFCLALVPARALPSQEEIESYTKVGQQMPSFTVTELGGAEINMDSLKGKVVLVNFWATWCAPCLVELPRLEKQIWQKFKSDDFVMRAIAREQSDTEIAAFKKERRLTFPMASDPDREIFKLFGNGGIPRNYVVGTDGKILFQSDGYAASEFGKMTALIDKELKKAKEVRAGK